MYTAANVKSLGLTNRWYVLVQGANLFLENYKHLHDFLPVRNISITHESHYKTSIAVV